jgi:hypothetical protein
MSGTEMRYASPDGNRWNFSLEPPDMALCVGGGYVVEGTTAPSRSSARPAWRPHGRHAGQLLRRLAGGVSSRAGIGDPSCQYDPQTKRFFMTWYVYGGVRAVRDAGHREQPEQPARHLVGLRAAGRRRLRPPRLPRRLLPTIASASTRTPGCRTTSFDFGQDPSPYAGTTIWGISKRAIIDSRGSFLLADVWGLGFDAWGGAARLHGHAGHHTERRL